MLTESRSEKKRIRHYLGVFFSHKLDSKGKPLRKKDVVTPENIGIVKLIDLMDAVDITWESLQENNHQGDPIKFYRALESECFCCCIPKRYFGGILIVYLKVCLGYSL